MSGEWGEPVEASSSAHDFETMPVLVGEFRRTDTVETKNGESRIHRFFDERSVQVDCWGSVDLDAKLANVKPGERVRIQFLGRKETNSGNSMKLYEVRVAQAGHSTRVDDPPADDDIPF